MKASSGGIQNDAGVQVYFASGLSFGTVFNYDVYTVDGFGNYVPYRTPPKAITPSNGFFYWNNGEIAIGTIVSVRVLDYQ